MGQVVVQFQLRQAGPRRARNVAFQVFQPERLFHDGAFFAIKRLHDAVFDIAGETLIQPRIAPTGVRHQVAGPAMRELMRDDIGERFIARNQGRRHKG